MRLTLLLSKGQPLTRAFPKSSFRRPMDGRNLGRKKPVTLWSLSLGELDETDVVDGKEVPDRSRVPVISVPDLKDFDLKPYVSYRTEDAYEPPMEARDFFNMFYAPEIEAKVKNMALESFDDETEKKTKTTLLKKLFAKDSKST